jgi:hypothetical protein
MKKTIILSFVFALAVSLTAQEKKFVEFTEKTHDFGVVQEGEGNGGKITNVFTFKNVGTTPLFIENAKASCGCTTPKIDGTKPILPDETGEVPVTYNTAGRPGNFNKSVTVTFKNGNGDTFSEVIYIKGDVTPKAQQQ